MKTITSSTKTIALITSLLATNTAFANPPPNTVNMRGSVMNYVPNSVRNEVVQNSPSMVNQRINQLSQSNPTPQQLYNIKKNKLDQERILSNPYLSTPNPVVRSLAVSLSPGEVPPLIRVSKNMLTSIVFTDMQGNPWYIDKVAINRDLFSDAANKPSTLVDQVPVNVLTIEPKQIIAYGNVSVTLKDKALPIILMIASGQPDVDIRIDAKIPGRNPDASYTRSSFASNSPKVMTEIDNDALAMLDGSIPADAEALIASDPAAQGWKYNNSLYVKTRLDILYPNYMSRASTTDGLTIYRFDGSNAGRPITLMQRQGQPVTVNFESTPYYQR